MYQIQLAFRCFVAIEYIPHGRSKGTEERPCEVL